MKKRHETEDLHAQVTVVGSGPGGSVAAGILAEAGLDVLLLEEGDDHHADAERPFSRDEMLNRYRAGGITAMLGRPGVSYAEGRCLGGGSEINAGLYHRLPETMREQWEKDFRIESFGPGALEEYFADNEREFPPLTTTPDAIAGRLLEAAADLGWSAQSVPRLQIRNPGDGPPLRASMTRTWIPRFRRAGGKVITGARAHRIARHGGGWCVSGARADHGQKRRFRILSDGLFVCCGAIGTPALLRASGIRRNIGNTLRAHVSVKAAANLGSPSTGSTPTVCPVQVKEFVPSFSLGCSVSGPGHARMFFLDRNSGADPVPDLPNHGVFYAAAGVGNGIVRNLPGSRETLVRFALSPADTDLLRTGLQRLAEWLLAAGARQVFPGVPELPPCAERQQIGRWNRPLQWSAVPLQTVHLMGSCPMGEDQARAATDSWGAVHGHPGLHICDASLFGGPAGVNPQGTIMALARRNAEHFISGLGRAP